MGVSWIVFPIVLEVVDWLQNQHGIAVPDVESRWATLAELQATLASFGEPVQVENIPGGPYPIVALTMGILGSSTFAQILGSIKDDHFEFAFEKSGNSRRLMLLILQKLSAHCGALVIFCGTGGQPYVVTAATDIDKALKTWDIR